MTWYNVWACGPSSKTVTWCGCQTNDDIICTSVTRRKTKVENSVWIFWPCCRPLPDRWHRPVGYKTHRNLFSKYLTITLTTFGFFQVWKFVTSTSLKSRDEVISTWARRVALFVEARWPIIFYAAKSRSQLEK